MGGVCLADETMPSSALGFHPQVRGGSFEESLRRDGSTYVRGILRGCRLVCRPDGGSNKDGMIAMRMTCEAIQISAEGPGSPSLSRLALKSTFGFFSARDIQLDV